MLAKRIAEITCLTILAIFVVVGDGSSAHATDATCPPPLMTCTNSTNGGACPTGYDCTCVPSCPNCRDCPARVCVAAADEKCRTACDCEPGLGCFDGQCIAGFAPVYCCDSATCPSGEQCQHRSGEMDRCSNPTCADGCGLTCERLNAAANKHIERIVMRASRCSSADECVRVDTSTRCQGTCGAWINARHQRNFDRVMSYIDRRMCTQHHDLGCPYSTPRCVNEEAVCERGRCRGQFVLSQTR